MQTMLARFVSLGPSSEGLNMVGKEEAWACVGKAQTAVWLTENLKIWNKNFWVLRSSLYYLWNSFAKSHIHSTIVWTGTLWTNVPMQFYQITLWNPWSFLAVFGRQCISYKGFKPPNTFPAFFVLTAGKAIQEFRLLKFQFAPAPESSLPAINVWFVPEERATLLTFDVLLHFKQLLIWSKALLFQWVHLCDVNCNLTRVLAFFFLVFSCEQISLFSSRSLLLSDHFFTIGFIVSSCEMCHLLKRADGVATECFPFLLKSRREKLPKSKPRRNAVCILTSSDDSTGVYWFNIVLMLYIALAGSPQKSQ